MPQANIFLPAVNPSGKAAPTNVDASGSQAVGKGLSSSLNLAAGTHVIKASPGRICRISVNTAQTALGAINDCTTTGAIAAANLVCSIPEAVGIYDIDFPCLAGIVVTVGTAGVVSVSFA